MGANLSARRGSAGLFRAAALLQGGRVIVLSQFRLSRQLGNHVLDVQLLAFQVGQALLVGQRPGDLVSERDFEIGMLGAERFNSVLQRHDRSFPTV
jgi:hypothetical protein